jgi:hypothetical protein
MGDESRVIPGDSSASWFGKAGDRTVAPAGRKVGWLLFQARESALRPRSRRTLGRGGWIREFVDCKPQVVGFDMAVLIVSLTRRSKRATTRTVRRSGALVGTSPTLETPGSRMKPRAGDGARTHDTWLGKPVLYH